MCDSPLQVKAAVNTDEESKSLGMRRIYRLCACGWRGKSLGMGIWGAKMGLWISVSVDEQMGLST